MTLTCKWAKDRTGDLIMKWTEDEVSMMKSETRRLTKNPTTPDHEHRATGPVFGAMLPAWLTPKALAADTVPDARVQVTPWA